MGIISGGKVIEGAAYELGAPALEGAQAGGLVVARAGYDFAVDGGAVGAINLLGNTGIPSGAVILGGFIDVITPLASGGSATVALKVEGTADLLAATAFGSAPWSSAGRKAILPVFTAASSVKTSAARDVVATIAAAALTAGKFDVYLVYMVTG